MVSVLCSNGLAKGWFISISISLCSFVMHVCLNLEWLHVLKERKKGPKKKKTQKKAGKKEEKKTSKGKREIRLSRGM